MPTALLARSLLPPGLLLWRSLLTRPLTPTPGDLTRLTTLAWTTLTRTALAWLTRLRPDRLLLSRLLTPSATTLLRGTLAPAAATLARLLLSPAALTLTSPLVPARLAPRLPRTPRSLWRRRHIRSLDTCW